MTLELTKTEANNAEAINGVDIIKSDLQYKIMDLLTTAFASNWWSGWYLHLLLNKNTGEMTISSPARNNTYFSPDYVTLYKVEQFYMDYSKDGFEYDEEENLREYMRCDMYLQAEFIFDEIEHRLDEINENNNIDIQIFA